MLRYVVGATLAVLVNVALVAVAFGTGYRRAFRLGLVTGFNEWAYRLESLRGQLSPTVHAEERAALADALHTFVHANALAEACFAAVAKEVVGRGRP